MKFRWLVVCCLLVHAQANSEQRILGSDPLSLHIGVNQERRVDWPTAVEVALPTYLQSLVRVQSVRRSTFWRASMPFSAARVLVREIDSGRTYLVDLSAIEREAQLPPITVQAKAERAATHTRPPYVQLIRTAAGALFSPARLVNKPVGFVREPVGRDDVALLAGAASTSKPLAQWRYRGHYVTAVEIENATTNPIELDARVLRGAWYAAAFMHFRLLGKDSGASTTVVYLVSAAPFDEVLTRDVGAR